MAFSTTLKDPLPALRSGVGDIYKASYTTKGIMGTGLGLWVSCEIIARHNGKLRVLSRHDSDRSGTVFQLFLPSQGT